MNPLAKQGKDGAVVKWAKNARTWSIGWPYLLIEITGKLCLVFPG